VPYGTGNGWFIGGDATSDFEFKALNTDVTDEGLDMWAR
jgi:hypothetical protein